MKFKWEIIIELFGAKEKATYFMRSEIKMIENR